MSNNRLTDYLSLSFSPDAPKISIYMPTHRTSPENQQDPTRYRDLLKQVKADLETNYDEKVWQTTFNQLAQLVDNRFDFWNYTKEGLAILASDEKIEVFKLRQTLPSFAQVGDNFNLLPLLAYYETRYPVLLVDISRDSVELYEADQFSYQAIEVEDIEKDFYNIFDDMDSENNQTTVRGAGSVHSNQTKEDNIEDDRDYYFNYLDSQLKTLSQESNLPVLLAGTRENIAEYRKIAKADIYVDVHIDQPISNESQARVKELLDETLGQLHKKMISDSRKRLDTARGAHRIQSLTEDIYQSAQAGRIEELVIDASAVSNSDKRLHDIVANILATKGRVTVIDRDPETEETILETPYEAILRY